MLATQTGYSNSRKLLTTLGSSRAREEHYQYCPHVVWHTLISEAYDPAKIDCPCVVSLLYDKLPSLSRTKTDTRGKLDYEFSLVGLE